MYKYINEVNIIQNKLFDEDTNKKSKVFYIGRINKFFETYMSLQSNCNKPLNAITFFDINTFLENLECSNADCVNIYYSLKRFFDYTYFSNITPEIMSSVNKPSMPKKDKQILSDEQYLLLKNFIISRNSPILERLLLGLFLFTGLSRKYIANLRNTDFIFHEGVYKLRIYKDGLEYILPLKTELQLIVNEYLINLEQLNFPGRTFKLGENYLSSYVSNLVQNILGKKITPTVLSNTFIHKALSTGNHIYEVSTLTLESVSTIEEHIKDTSTLIHRQASILNSF